MYLIVGKDDFETKNLFSSIKYKMFLETLPLPFHTRAVPLILITVVCEDVDLTESRNVRDLLVTDIGLLLMLFICSLAYSSQVHEHTRNYDDRSGNVHISLVPM